LAKNVKEPPEVQQLVRRRRLNRKTKTAPPAGYGHESPTMLIDSDTDGSLGTGTENDTSGNKHVENSGRGR
jgi:hypothetical protein